MGAVLPVRQFHDWVPAARRRQSNCSWSAYMPGMNPVDACGASANSIKALSRPKAFQAGPLAEAGLPVRAKLVQ